MKAKDIIAAIEKVAPRQLQEDYDNTGLQCGDPSRVVTKVLCCLDVTEEVVHRAISMGAEMIVSHHPLLFHGCKQITGATYVERCLLKAIGNGVSIYSAHTNLDNARGGVSFKMAEKLGLGNVRFLDEKPGFDAGSGVIGELGEAMSDVDFLRFVKREFGVACLMHSKLHSKDVRKIAVCGGSGSFLLENAIAAGADVFLTGEAKYHEFFGFDKQIVMAVIGHYESEQFTNEILYSIISGACPGIRIVKTDIVTNPINYL